MVDICETLETAFGADILSDLTGESLTRNGQSVRLFDTTATTSEMFYKDDGKGKPYIQNFQERKRWYPVNAYAQLHQLSFKESLSTLASLYGFAGENHTSLRPRKRFGKASPVANLSSLKPDTIPPHTLDFTRCTYDQHGQITSYLQKQFDCNGLTVYLRTLFGLETACWLVDRYLLGTSKRYRFNGHLSTVLPQIDYKGRIRQLKVMAFNPQTGRRLKKRDYAEEWNLYANKYEGCLDKNKVYFLGKDLNPAGHFRQCFFGEHLLREDPNKPVAIVEAESTALVCSVYLPEYLWLATGGSDGCRWYDPTVFMALAGRNVILFPDNGMIKKNGEDVYVYDDWKQKAESLRTLKIARSITVNDLLFQNSTGPTDKRDLRDFLITTDQTGFAVDEGVPVFWNLPNEYYIKGKQLADAGMMSPRPVEPYAAEPIPEWSSSPIVGPTVQQAPTTLPADEVVGDLTPDFTELSKVERDFIQLVEKNPAVLDLVRAFDMIPVG